MLPKHFYLLPLQLFVGVDHKMIEKMKMEMVTREKKV